MTGAEMPLSFCCAACYNKKENVDWMKYDLLKHEVIAMSRIIVRLLVSVLSITLLCGCQLEYPRPEFDTVRITYQDNSTATMNQFSGPDIQIVRESTNPEVMNELWEIYANLEVYDINRGLGVPRYIISYIKDGNVVEEWMLSQDWVVSGGRFGTNHTLENTVEYTGDSKWYNRITELFEAMDS